MSDSRGDSDRNDQTLAGLFRLISDNHDASEQGHHRLRNDYRSLETRMQALERNRVADELHFTHIDAALLRPTEVSALRFTPTMVVWLLAISVSIVGGIWIIRADVQGLSVQMRMQDERAAGFKSQLDSMQRLQQLQQYDIQSLKETVLKFERTGK